VVLSEMKGKHSFESWTPRGWSEEKEKGNTVRGSKNLYALPEGMAYRQRARSTLEGEFVHLRHEAATRPRKKQRGEHPVRRRMPSSLSQGKTMRAEQLSLLDKTLISHRRREKTSAKRKVLL